MSSGKIRVTGIRPTEKSVNFQLAPEHPPTKTLDLLRFVALSTSVHADAVDAATDATQSALLQMRSEDETLNHLDVKLQALLKEQQRLHSVRDAIARSRDGRRQTEALLREQQQRLEEERERVRGLGGKRIQSSRRAPGSASDGRQSIAEAGPEELENDDGISSIDTHAIDVEVERCKRLIAETNKMSIRAKLLELEVLKNRVREVDGRALMRDLVVGFTFPGEVEALWGADPSSDTTSPAATDDAAVKRRGRPPFEASGRASASSLQGPLCAVDHTNVDLLLARATQRLTGRYKDALSLLTNAALDNACRPQQAYGSLLYADYLDAEGGNPDAAAVQELQSFSRSTLADHYKEKCRMAIVDAKISESCLPPHERGREKRSSSTASSEPTTSPSVLSDYTFCALPTDWPATSALTAVSPEELLPPARHVLTPRFSFANVEELRRLERLRVDIQRRLIRDLLDDAPLLEDMLLLSSSTRARSAPSNKERFVSETRMAVTAAAAAAGRPHTWPTIVSATSGSEGGK